MAKQERVNLSERICASSKWAKRKGTKLGQPSLKQTSIGQIRRFEGGSLANYAIGKALKLSTTTVAKYMS